MVCGGAAGFVFEALHQFDECSLEVAAAVTRLFELLVVLLLEAFKPFWHLIGVILLEYLVHFVVRYLLPGAVGLLFLDIVLVAIEAAEASRGVTLQIVQRLPVPILERLFPQYLLLSITLAHAQLDLVVAVRAEALEVFVDATAVYAQFLRMLGLESHTADVAVVRASTN